MTAPQAGRNGRPWRRITQRIRRRRDPCHICGQPIDYDLPHTDPASFTVDHLIPLSHAPELAHNPSNLAAAHRNCNSAKGNGTPPPQHHTSERW